jgi:adenylyltransferase/sulfurtransferase
MNQTPAVTVAEPSEVKRRLDSGEDLLLIDVREPAEIAIAAIEGALVCPLSRAESWIDHLPHDRPLVILCHHGIRSMQAAMALSQRGYRDLTNMSGGIDQWSLQVDPGVPRY